MTIPARAILALAAALALAPGAARAGAYAYATFDLPGGGNARVGGINNAGTVVGTYALPALNLWGEEVRGYLRDAAGGLASFAVPGGLDHMGVTGINDAGQVVGAAWYGLDGYFKAFVRGADGVITFLPGQAQGTSTFATGINNAGQVAGWRLPGPLYGWPIPTEGFVGDLAGGGTGFSVPGAVLTYAVGISNAGAVVGRFDITPGSGFPGSFLRDAAGVITVLDFPAVSGINAAGAIAGQRPFEGVGYVRAPGGEFSAIAVPGARDTQVEGINDAGQVVGSWTDSGFVTRGFVATPVDVPVDVPEPWSLACAGAWLAALAWMRWGVTLTASPCGCGPRR